ncbi:hypothetical protein [Mesorhizobium sp.]|uniref:hypothetical protein n=1 Tax=Mesorhizobium sp. TaxID=1871066 RepID=UPI0025E50495|nr:hypothetical protein [Mesorhizobium sp.]
MADLPNADQASLVPNVMPAARGSSRECAETVLMGSVSAAFSARVELSAVGGSPNTYLSEAKSFALRESRT